MVYWKEFGAQKSGDIQQINGSSLRSASPRTTEKNMFVNWRWSALLDKLGAETSDGQAQEDAEWLPGQIRQDCGDLPSMDPHLPHQQEVRPKPLPHGASLDEECSALLVFSGQTTPKMILNALLPYSYFLISDYNYDIIEL